jgi:hypothetical protein
MDCGVGISSMNSSPVISGNSFAHSPGAMMCRAIECVQGGRPDIVSNQITGTVNEALWCNAVSPTVEGNIIKQCYGVVLLSCTSPMFRSNTMVETSLSIQACASAAVESNTFVDNELGVEMVANATGAITRNIVVGGSIGFSCELGGTASFSCNDLYGMATKYNGTCSDQTGLNGNISEDPQFCGQAGSGNYLLQLDSPCAPTLSVQCGLIGAYSVGCATTSVKQTTWGAIKKRYLH